MAESKYPKTNKDFTILRHIGYDYQISWDLLSFNDYFIDFELHHGSNPNAVQRCDSLELLVLINSHYLNTEPIHRRSARIAGSNDPVLNLQGVPGVKY
jgi:hypothetical protein